MVEAAVMVLMDTAAFAKLVLLGKIANKVSRMYLRGVLLNYQFAMNLLLWKVSSRYILKTRRPKEKIFFLQNLQITALFD